MRGLVGWLGVGIRQLQESDPEYIHTIKLIHANNPLSTIFTAASTNWIEVWRCNSTELHQSSGATVQRCTKFIRAAVQKAYQSSGAKQFIRAAVQKVYQSSVATVQRWIRAVVQGCRNLSEQRCNGATVQRCRGVSEERCNGAEEYQSSGAMQIIIRAVVCATMKRCIRAAVQQCRNLSEQ